MQPKNDKIRATKSTNLRTFRNTIENLNKKQIATDREKVASKFKVPDNALLIFDMFCQTPELDIATITKNLSISRQAVAKIVKKLCTKLDSRDKKDRPILSKVAGDKKWGTKYRYDALYGSAADFAHNTTRSQNVNGLFLYFDGMEQAETLAKTPTKAKFRPYKYHNAEPSNAKSQNKLFIGDNLDIMKFIMPEYERMIDLAYLDIPYNMPSNRMVQAYDDSFDGTCDLLCHLYPRLMLVKKLLKDDGIVALSVSEHEVCYVKALMDHIFGRNNLVNNIVIEMAAPAGVLSGFTEHRLIPVKSYLLVYAKDCSLVKFNRLYDFSVSTKFATAFNTVIESNGGQNPVYTQTALIDYLKAQPKIAQIFKKHNLAIQTNNIEKLMDLDTDFEEYIYQDLSKIVFKPTKPVSNPLKNDFNAPTDVVFVHNDKLYLKQKIMLFIILNRSLTNYTKTTLGNWSTQT